jgi:RimJ/RimL family protein N-acetyltransferase
MDLEDVWPLFGLRLLTPRLELRPVRDEDLGPLADAALAGIHDAGFMPFGVPWTDAAPEDLRRSLAQHNWRVRSELSRDSWGINFAILFDGVAVGTQSLAGKRFGVLRTVSTGSWLTRSAQGRGVGTEMRAAVLLFAFDWLEADYAESGAVVANGPSTGVSRRLGYSENGRSIVEARPGEAVEHVGFRMHRNEFVRPDWELRVEGFEAARSELL